MTEAALDLLRQFFMEQIQYARYQANGVWYLAEISNVDVLESGHVVAMFEISPGNDVMTVTQAEFYGLNDVLLVRQDTNITRRPEDERLFFSMRVKIIAA